MQYAVGDPVIFRMQKSSSSPGQRAREIHPNSKGENYSYVVEKHWSVQAVHDDGTVTLITRRGKEHRLESDEPNLRPANLIERIIYRKRFPKPHALG